MLLTLTEPPSQGLGVEMYRETVNTAAGGVNRQHGVYCTKRPRSVHSAAQLIFKKINKSSHQNSSPSTERRRWKTEPAKIEKKDAKIYNQFDKYINIYGR